MIGKLRWQTDRLDMVVHIVMAGKCLPGSMILKVSASGSSRNGTMRKMNCSHQRSISRVRVKCGGSAAKDMNGKLG